MEYDPAVAVLAAFEREGGQYCVFGGIAINIHGLPRFTEGLDVFVAPARVNIERLKAARRSVFQDPSIEEISAEGTEVNVATPRMLYRMKKDTVPPLDRIDAEALRQRFGLKNEP